GGGDPALCAALLMPRRDPAALADAVLRIMIDPHLGQSLIRAPQSCARQRRGPASHSNSTDSPMPRSARRDRLAPRRVSRIGGRPYDRDATIVAAAPQR